MPEPRTVLAVGLDAAEPALVDAAMTAGVMPHLAALAARGRRGRVAAPAWLGSGAVWPSFTTGTEPLAHGLFGDWAWDADAMRLVPARFDHLRPFWARFAERGRGVAVLDVPFAPPLRQPGVAEVLDWGAHDWLGGATQVCPPTLAPLVARAGVHPFAARALDIQSLAHEAGLRRVADDASDGAVRRGTLAAHLFAATGASFRLVVFEEVHRASHLLWHAAHADHPWHRRDGETGGGGVSSGLDRVLRSVDEQVGRLAAQAGEDAAVFVFSLHGMRAACGVPNLLPGLLEAWGWTTRAPALRRTGAQHARELARAAKRLVPAGLRRAYYRHLPRRAVMRLAQPAAPLPACAWSATKALALPTDQHGWIRLNLHGREAAGAVPPDAYAAACDELEQRLRAVRTVDGRPLVDDVLRTAGDAGRARGSRLPDLVVHWSDATRDVPLRLEGLDGEHVPLGTHVTGQHAPEGFFVGAGGSVASSALPARVRAEALHEWFEGWLRP